MFSARRGQGSRQVPQVPGAQDAVTEAGEELVESVIVGTVIGDAVFTALRRLAHVHVSDQVFGRVTERPDDVTA